jgi:alpha-glucoside transport system substrate-binding protein
MKTGLGITLVTLLSLCGFVATPLPAAQADVVDVLGLWSGGELRDFQDVVSPWEQKTGHTMAFVSTRDLNAVLTTRLKAGDPPEVAGITHGPGLNWAVTRGSSMRFSIRPRAKEPSGIVPRISRLRAIRCRKPGRR